MHFQSIVITFLSRKFKIINYFKLLRIIKQLNRNFHKTRKNAIIFTFKKIFYVDCIGTDVSNWKVMMMNVVTVDTS